MTHKNDFLEMADRDEERVHLGGKAVFDQDLLGGSAPKSGKNTINTLGIIFDFRSWLSVAH